MCNLLKKETIRCLSGYLYVHCAGELLGFITNAPKLSNEDHKIILPIGIVNSIIEQDDVFGVLVGGAYFYFAMPVKLENVMLSYQKEQINLVSADSFIMFEDGLQKSITL